MTILQALDHYYDRMAARGDVTPVGWSAEPIGVVVVINKEGQIVEVIERLDEKGKRGLPERVPKWFGRSGQGSTPFIFWDNAAYALGVNSGDPKKAKDADKTKRDHDAFKKLHFEALEMETDEGLLALRRFLENWRPEQFAEPMFSDRMTAFNVAFRLDEPGSHEFIHQRPAAKKIVEQLRGKAAASESANCLVTGQYLPVVRLHPKIKGVNGTASAEVPLTSFNEPAFESYGKEQGYNAPTSERAAIRYTSALTALLDRDKSRNRLKRGVGDATVIFWADVSGATEEEEAKAEVAEDFFASLVEPPSDETEAKKIRDRLDLLAEGRAVEALNAAGLQSDTRFHILGLSPNAARLSVRFWLTDDFGAFVQRLAEHFEDLNIEPLPWRNPPSINYLLMRTTALQDKADNVPPLLAGEMMRAVLAGTRYPQTLLAAAIARLRAGDDAASGWHAAAIKAVLARDHRLKQRNRKEADSDQDNVERKDVERKEEKPPVSLERDDPHPAYQLGRLFAAVETAQRMALPGINATIRDRYFGAASATPASVFPLLMRGVQNHLGKLRKDGKGFWLEREIEEISDRLPPSLPRSLKLEQQGRFVLGYYHQRKGQFADAKAKQELAQAEIEVDTGDVDNG